MNPTSVTPTIRPALSPTSASSIYGARPLAQGSSAVTLLTSGDTRQHWNRLPQMVTAHQQLSTAASAGQDVLRLSTGNWNVGQDPKSAELAVLLQNLMGIHASALGNLEANLTEPVLANTLTQAKFRVLSSNSQPSSLALMTKVQFAPAIIEGAQGRYGVIGLTATETNKTAHPFQHQNNSGPNGLTVLDDLNTQMVLQQQVNQLAQGGTNRVIVLSSLSSAQNQRLAQQVNGIDVLVASGRTTQGKPRHQVVTHQEHPQAPTLLIEGGHNAESLGQTQLVFDALGQLQQFNHQAISLKQFAPSVSAQNLLQQRLGASVVAQVLTPVSNPNDRLAENPLANRLADQVRQLASADIALVRASEVRDSLDAGPLRDGQLSTMLPFQESYVVSSLSGADIQQAFTDFAQSLHQKAFGNRTGNSASIPSMLHPSGLRYHVPETPGQPVVVQVWSKEQSQWQPLDPNAHYSVAMSRYTATHSEAYPSLAQPAAIQWTMGQSLKDVLMSQLAKQSQPSFQNPQPGTPVLTLALDGRVSIPVALQDAHSMG